MLSSMGFTKIVILAFLLLGCDSDTCTPSEYFIVRHIEIKNEQVVRYTAKSPNNSFIEHKFIYFYDKMGKYNIGDTLMIVKKNSVNQVK